MASFNRFIGIGNLTRDVQLKTLPSGSSVCDFGLAMNDKVKRNDQWVDEPTFIDVTLFGKTAEAASNYLSKGSSVMIEGRLKLEQWEKDGVKHSRHKIIGDKMQMLDRKGDRPANQTAQAETDGEYDQGGMGDDIPF